MNRTLTIMLAAATMFPAVKSAAQDPMGTVSYALPQTTITLEVEAVRENFYAGPYAKFAQKYLGVDARQEDQQTCTLSAVKMTPVIEADQSNRYFVTPDKNSMSFLSLTSHSMANMTSPAAMQRAMRIPQLAVRETFFQRSPGIELR